MAAPDQTSLTAELGLLRTTLELLLTKLQTKDDVEVHEGRILTIVASIERLVKTKQGVDQINNSTLTKQQVLAFADAVVRISEQFSDDPRYANFVTELKGAVNDVFNIERPQANPSN
jgi:hypothetical protein